MEKADVVIVGGGLAGLSAAATLCTESDLSVMLIEEKEIGSNQGIRAVFPEAINKFGLEESRLCEYRSFIWHSPFGALSTFNYGKTELVGVDYKAACTILFKRAESRGLNLLKARALNCDPEVPDHRRPPIVNLEDGTRVETQVLVDASGCSQWSVNNHNMRPSRYFSVCYGEVLSGCDMENKQAFRFLGPCARYGNGGGWFYPCGPGRVSFGYSVVVREKPTNFRGIAERYFAAKREFKPYAHWVREAACEAVDGGIIPVGRIDRFVADRLIVIGDAGGQAYPWAIEGCRPALINGSMCGRVVIDAFAKGRFDRGALSTFERRWNKTNRNRFWRTAAIADLTWSYPDQAWDDIIRGAQFLPAEQQLRGLRDNPATSFQKVYAVAGYGRRQMVRWVRERWFRNR